MHLLLAASWLDPFVNFLSAVVMFIDKYVGNLGISLIILAALIRAAFWPLNTKQFKAFLEMQKIAPLLKRVQDRYKDDKQKQQQEMMALYKEHNVSPLAGCWPLLVQYPVIISVYYVVLNHKALFANQNFLWIGTAFTQGATAPAIFGTKIFAANLSLPDLVLILLYAFSMYLSVRYVSQPATDPQQAQMQRTMAFVSPIMLGFFGWKYHWPSAMVLYWFSYNVFTMAQQLYLLRRYHQPLGLIDSEHVITEGVGAGGAGAKSSDKAAPSGNGVAKPNQPNAARSSRSKRKNKKR
ncbi:MAG TPA: YidC/Oxa1 family membrane protein insertase [Candidatus Cybelea sp.]|nr:YidC/Oxa1 family membrane protein insertase [Candidatus Cybelea sp.]